MDKPPKHVEKMGTYGTIWEKNLGNRESVFGILISLKNTRTHTCYIWSNFNQRLVNVMLWHALAVSGLLSTWESICWRWNMFLFCLDGIFSKLWFVWFWRTNSWGIWTTKHGYIMIIMGIFIHGTYNQLWFRYIALLRWVKQPSIGIWASNSIVSTDLLKSRAPKDVSMTLKKDSRRMGPSWTREPWEPKPRVQSHYYGYPHYNL